MVLGDPAVPKAVLGGPRWLPKKTQTQTKTKLTFRTVSFKPHTTKRLVFRLAPLQKYPQLVSHFV